MQKQFLRLLHLGQNTFWQLLQDTNAASEEQLQAWQKAVQQVPLHVWMGDKTTEGKAELLQHLQEWQLPYTVHDCTGMDIDALEALSQEYGEEDTLNITCGFNETETFLLSRESAGSWFNGLSTCTCSWSALAEAAFTVALTEDLGKELNTWRICWMSAMTPTSQSLMEAAIYTPFELFMGIPSWSDPDHSITDMALKAGAKVFMTREPRLALDDAHIIYMDPHLEAMTKAKTPTKPIPIFSASDNFVWEKGLALTQTYLDYALPHAHVVATEPGAAYALSEAALQSTRSHLRRATLLACLHHMVSE